MKKLTLLLFILFTGNLIFAQDGDFKKFNFGLRFDPVFSFFKTDTRGAANDGMRLGFSYGLMGDFNFSENYAIASEIKFTHLGGNYSYTYGPDTAGMDDLAYKSKLYLQYLEIPLTLKMKTNEIGYVTYYGQFGFALGVLTKARQELSHPNSNDFGERESNYSEIQPLRLAMVIGAGGQYSLGGNTSLLAGITFNNGLTGTLRSKPKELDNVNADDQIERPSLKSAYIAVNLGVLF